MKKLLLLLSLSLGCFVLSSCSSEVKKYVIKGHVDKYESDLLMTMVNETGKVLSLIHICVVLDEILGKTNLTYRQERGIIIIVPQEKSVEEKKARVDVYKRQIIFLRW